MDSVDLEILRIRIFNRRLAHGAALSFWMVGVSAAQDRPLEDDVSVGTQSLTYARSDLRFANPERGFYRQFVAFDLGDARRPLSASSMRGLRDQGVSIVRVYFVIDEFIDRPLSQDALDDIASDFDEVRRAGLKIIPRFAYSFPCRGSGRCTEEQMKAEGIDPPLRRVLEHIDQLTPVLRANSDVVAFMEMGFVGAWGEWHHSSTGLVNPDRTTNARSAAIVDRIMAALPKSRMAVLRYPYHKQSLFHAKALDESDAFTGSLPARIGAHNDCFLATADDRGTYAPPSLGPPEKNVQALKKFLSLDNRFVPQDGETCSAEGNAQPFISCANAVRELATMHWSALNDGYRLEVLNLWRREGCFAEVQNRLGYRFRLLTAEIPAQVKAGAPLNLRFVMTNDGFASPFNPRNMELVLRHTVSGRLHRTPIKDDLRLWGSGETRTVHVQNLAPLELETGSYDVLLSLPDPEPRLRERAEYSIRLANADVWEPATGTNRLRARILVVN